MAVNKSKTVFGLIKFFGSRVDTFKDESRKSFRKALLSFRRFVYSYYLYDSPFNEELVIDWYVYLRLKGITSSKAYYYIDKLGNLYSAAVKKFGLKDEGLFRQLRQKIKESEKEKTATLPFTLSSVPAVLSFINDKSDYSQTSLGFDLMMFSLLNGALSVRELVRLKKEDADSLNPESKKIAKKYIGSRRKYIFPLDQGKLTSKQCEEMAAQLLRKELEEIRITGYDNIDDTILLIWICLALQGGVPVSGIVSALVKIPSCLSFMKLSLCPGDSGLERESVISKVSSFISGEREKWFAMRLRPYVRYEELISRMAGKEVRDLLPELFYPCDEIAKRIGKKLIWKEQPVIRDIVFFKMNPGNILPMFRHIWDLAWCYRENSGKGGYAEIRPEAMEEFQKAIGFFSPEFEVAPAGKMPLKPGDKVVIIGGDYKDQKAKILSKETTGDSDTVYRLQLLDSFGRWFIGMDARLLRHVN